jgi:hypothetical protein
MRLDGDIAADADHVRVSPLGQGRAEVGVLAVAGIRHHHRRHQCPAGQFLQGVQGQAPLLPVPDLLGDAGPPGRAASSVHSRGRNSRQFSGQEAVSETACTLTATWQLACLPSAPQYWGATPTDILPSLGNDTSSTAQASGPACGTIRSAIRRRTGTGSHVDWFTNCCRFCSLPSGSRETMAWIDLRRPSVISPRR